MNKDILPEHSFRQRKSIEATRVSTALDAMPQFGSLVEPARERIAARYRSEASAQIRSGHQINAVLRHFDELLAQLDFLARKKRLDLSREAYR